MLVGIVAITEDGLMGKANGLPWEIKDDLRLFKSITDGKTLIVGAETFKNLPYLPNRKFVVVSRSETLPESKNEVISHIQHLETLEEYVGSSDKYYLIGGNTIYNLLMDKCEYFLMTRILSKEFIGEVYFDIERFEHMFTPMNRTLVTDRETGIDFYFELHRRNLDVRKFFNE